MVDIARGVRARRRVKPARGAANGTPRTRESRRTRRGEAETMSVDNTNIYFHMSETLASREMLDKRPTLVAVGGSTKRAMKRVKLRSNTSGSLS